MSISAFVKRSSSREGSSEYGLAHLCPLMRELEQHALRVESNRTSSYIFRLLYRLAKLSDFRHSERKILKPVQATAVTEGCQLSLTA